MTTASPIDLLTAEAAELAKIDENELGTGLHPRGVEYAATFLATYEREHDVVFVPVNADALLRLQVAFADAPFDRDVMHRISEILDAAANLVTP
jgi:hypothetical protein